MKLYVLLVLLCTVIGIEAQQALYIQSIRFTGVDSHTEADLQSTVKPEPHTPYSVDEQQKLATAILDHFKQQGYYFTNIDSVDVLPLPPDKVQLTYHILPGPNGKDVQLHFTGNHYFTELKLRQNVGLSPAQTVNLTYIPTLCKRIVSLYTSRGYLFASAALDSLYLTTTRQDSLHSISTLNAVIGIEEGKLFHLDHYQFYGNKVTRPNTLLSISGLNQIKNITPDVLDQAEANLLRKTYLKTAAIYPLNENTLAIHVEEGRMTRIEGVLGIANQQEGKGKLSGYVNMQFLNLWGTDRGLMLNWRSIPGGYQNLRLSYHEAGLYHYPFSGDITFAREAQDTTWTRMSATLDVYYRLLYHRLGTSLSNETYYPGSAASGIDTVGVKSRQAGFFWEYQRLDFNANPRQGQRWRLYYGWLFREENVRHDDSTSVTVPRAEFDTAIYLPLFSRFTYMLAAHYRHLSLRNARVYEQYKLGGFSTLRGYLEDEFSSRRLAWLNSEVRYLLTRDSRLFLLTDYGMFLQDNQKWKTGLFGLGVGMAVATKVGNVNVSYAIPYNSKRLSSLTSGIIHLGLESSF